MDLIELEVPSETKEDLFIAVSSELLGNLALWTPKIGVNQSQTDAPEDADYQTASWMVEDHIAPVQSKYRKCKVATGLTISGAGGGGTFQLAEGEHFAWISLELGGKKVRRIVGRITVT